MDGKTIDFDRESASPIEHAQVMKRATNIISEMRDMQAYMDYSAHHVRY